MGSKTVRNLTNETNIDEGTAPSIGETFFDSSYKTRSLVIKI